MNNAAFRVVPFPCYVNAVINNSISGETMPTSINQLTVLQLFNLSCTRGIYRCGNSLTANPQFVSSFDLHLQSSSPAINSGSNVLVPSGISTDIENNTRIICATVDMGAYEKSPNLRLLVVLFM